MCPTDRREREGVGSFPSADGPVCGPRAGGEPPGDDVRPTWSRAVETVLIVLIFLVVVLVIALVAQRRRRAGGVVVTRGRRRRR